MGTEQKILGTEQKISVTEQKNQGSLIKRIIFGKRLFSEINNKLI